jgi:hypothetical protein
MTTDGDDDNITANRDDGNDSFNLGLEVDEFCVLLGFDD